MDFHIWYQDSRTALVSCAKFSGNVNQETELLPCRAFMFYPIEALFMLSVAIRFY